MKRKLKFSGVFLSGALVGFLIAKMTPETSRFEPAVTPPVISQTEENGASPLKTVPPTAVIPQAPPERPAPVVINGMAPRRKVETRERIDAIRELSDSDRFLSETRLPNFFDAIKNAKPFKGMNEELNQLNGRFSGEVRFFEDPKKKWDMVVETALRMETGTLKGSAEIILAENGKTFSHKSGTGDQKDFQATENNLGVIIKASPDDYFQIYYVPKMDRFIGNYYKQTAPDQVTAKGTVILERG